MKEKRKVAVAETEKREPKILLPINRETASPCKSCRKRCSCFIRPRDGYCMGFEPGEPWSMPSPIVYSQTDLLEDEIDS